MSLGTTRKQIFESAMSIKQSEVNRTVCILSKNVKDKEVEQPCSLVLNTMSALTGDLEDEEVDRTREDQSDFPVLYETVKRTRKKKDYSSSNKRRSARIKIQNRKKKCII